jgi:microcystin-dependent protein
MADLDLQYDLANATPANANPLEANFNRIEQHVNQEVIRRDGVVAMTAQLKLVGDPVSALDAVALQFLNQLMPIGIMMMWPGSSAPPGGRWAIANNATVATATYPDLFAVYGYAWGGVGANFKLPYYPGTMPITPGGAFGTVLGYTGGNKDAIIPEHDHSIDHTHPTVWSGDEEHPHTHTMKNHTHGGSTGGAGAHAHNFGDPSTILYNGGTGLGGLTEGTGGINFATFQAAANHVHDIRTDGPNDNTSDNNNRGHRHGVPAMAHAGKSSNAWGGVSPVNANIPPVSCVNIIVRVL